MSPAAFAVALSLIFVGPAAPAPTLDPQARNEAAASAFAEGERAFGEERYADAVEEFERANDLVPHDDTLFNLGLALEHSGENERAWAVFSELATRDSTNAGEAAAHRDRIARELAVVVIFARPRESLCVDGTRPRADGEARWIVTSTRNAVNVDLDGERVEFPVRAGREYVVDLTRRGDPPRDRRRPWRNTALGVGVGGGALALGLAVGALSLPPGEAGRDPLIASSAGAAGLGLAGATMALVLARPSSEVRPTRAASTWTCGSEAAAQDESATAG